MVPIPLSSAQVTTVALNPAVDQTICVDRFTPDTVNRAKSFRLDAGGKGVNVASFLSSAGCQVTATGFLGNENAAIFEDFFAHKSINDRFIRLSGYTRVGVKIVDDIHQQTTDINLPGLVPSPEELDQLMAEVTDQAARCHWIVLTGSLPPGVPADFYARIIHLAKSTGCLVALDTSQPALLPGIAAGPALVKPNLAEVEELAGYPLSDLAAVATASRQILDRGVDLAVISMGSQGAVFTSSSGSIIAHVPQVTVKTTVGAGDAMISGLLISRILDLDLAASAQLSTAFSAAAVSSLDRQLPDLETLRQAANQIVIEDLSAS